MRKVVTEPGGTLQGANRGLAVLLKEWLERNGEQSSGVIVIGLYGAGFDVQYMGSEALSGRDLENRVLWIADQIRGGTQVVEP